MGYLAAIIEPLFKEAGDGRTIFFPYGQARDGYVLPPQRSDKVKRALRLFWCTSAGTLLVAVYLFSLSGVWVVGLAGAAYCILARVWMRNAVKAPPIGAPGPTRTLLRKMGNSMGVAWSLALILLSALLLAACVVSLSVPGNMVWGAVGTAFFAFTLAMALLMTREVLAGRRRGSCRPDTRRGSSGGSPAE